MPNALPATERVITTPPYRAVEQQHDWQELIVPITGTYKVVCGAIELSVEPGQALFTPSGVRHLPRLSSLDPVVFYCCMWNAADGWQTLAEPTRLQDSDGHLLLLTGLMSRLTRRNEESPVRQALREAYVLPIQAAIDFNVAKSDGLRDERVARVVAHLHGNLADQNRTKDLAVLVGMSANGLIKLFRSVTGFTPARYLQGIRLERALALLSGSTLSLQQIAEDIGYASASHLCQLIQKRTGRTARSFRGAVGAD